MLALVVAAQKIALAGGALAVLVGGLHWFDRRCGFQFARWLGHADEPGASASPGYGVYLGARFVGLCLLIGLILGCTPAQASTFPDAYDTEIHAAAGRWMPTVDWRAWKAQLIAESQLDPRAQSSAGAQGIAQFMPATWREQAPRLGYAPDTVSPFVAEAAIEVGAAYMARLRTAWSAPRPDDDRHCLAAASYNAGLGHLLAAQRRAGGARDCPPVLARLHEVTGRHATETRGYVRRIWQVWAALLVGA